MEAGDNQAAGVAFDRDSPERHLASGGRRFVQCSFDEADLSRLDLQDCVFDRCTFTDTILYACKLARSTWQRCRAMSADFESAAKVDAQAPTLAA